MPIVDYRGRPFPDEALRATLQRIADVLGRVVRVTSGDRTSVPRGGAKGSLRLSNHAVDFHVEGIDDATAFAVLRGRRQAISGPAQGNDFRYQFIRHGPFARTQGAHIHLGLAPPGFAGLRGFIVEGLQPGQHTYNVVEAP